MHEDFPDVIGFFEDVGQEELASFASRAFVHERETLSVARPQPYSQGLVLGSALLLVWIAFRLVAFGLTTPIDMTSIKYVARFRLSLPFRVALVAILGGLALVIGRTLLIGFEWIALRYVVTTESYWVQTSSFAAMLVTGIAVLVTYMAMIPRKILVFPSDQGPGLSLAGTQARGHRRHRASTVRVGVAIEATPSHHPTHAGTRPPRNLAQAREGTSVFLPSEEEPGATSGARGVEARPFGGSAARRHRRGGRAER